MGLTATKARPARRDVPKSRGGRPTKTAAIERDQRLIEVATRLFLDRGYDATSLDAVAEAARVSKPTVYSRYGDKRGLFAEVLRREIARWLAPLAEAAEMQLTRSSDISVEQRLIGLGVLHDQLRLAIDRQNKGMPGLSKAVQEIDRVALEVTERPNIVGNVQHGSSPNLHRI